MTDATWVVLAVFGTGAFAVMWRTIGVLRETVRDNLRSDERGREARDQLLEKFAEKAMNPQNLAVVEAHANERVRRTVELERTRREALRPQSTAVEPVPPETGTAEDYFEGE